jgi:mannose-1-phosphate guanylyltransferase/mannose-1-phosphate guanylyltransferase/mannose-6-phosphate isomerase
VSDTRNSYIRSERPLVAALGLEDVVVVATDDAVLVASKAKAEGIKTIVEALKKAGRTEPVTHPLVYRPWGSFVSLHHGDCFQVKRLTVNPGARISLQKHRHRAEHWIVVSGTALVTRDQEQRLLNETESIDIPLGATHRLENPGDMPLIVIEVQTGSYLGEDDIIRLEDTYGRA